MEREHNPRNEKPISLFPLTLEEALSKAMNVSVSSLSSDKYTDLIHHLASIRINGRDRSYAHDVAKVLLKVTLGEKWKDLADSRQDRLIRDSGNRLWVGYKRNRARPDQSTKEAAQQAINEELKYLEEQNQLDTKASH